MATHCAQPVQAWASPTKVGRRRMSSGSIWIRCLGQTAEQGLQGISCTQWSTGKTPSSHGGMCSTPTLPGCDLSISAVRVHSAGISPTSTPKARATCSPAILPVNIAAEASAISAASPASKTVIPKSRAFCVNSLTGSSPTAMSTVSQAKDFSVPGRGRKCSSTCAMVTDSTCSVPFALTTV